MRHNLCFAAIALAAIAGLAAPASADVWSKSYALTGKPQLTVDAGDGSVTILARNQNQIDAHVTTRGWSIGSEVKIEEHQTGNTVEINIRIPHGFFSFFPHEHSVSVELDVPRTADLNIHTGDGSISCDPVAGTITLDSGDGSISAQGLSGAVRLHSGDGSIQASGVDGSLVATSGDGRVAVHGRFDSLELRSGDGSIEASASAGSRIASSWSVRTGDGSIRLTLPANFSADLDAHTGDGRITVGFPVTVSGSLSRSTFRGKLGAGGGQLYLRSGDGSIHIDKQ
jgi:DUF4097 and DUF4098 domain-containing protein YvlB